MNTLTKIGRPLCFGFAILLWAIAPAQAQYVFTTIDDPVAKATNGTTYVTGIAGNTIVGYFFGPQLHGFYHVLGTTNYTTLDEPLGFVNGSSSTEAFGVSGGNIVGSYQNYANGAAGYYGFLYNITNGTYLTLDDSSGDYQGASHTWPTAIDGTNIVGYVGDNVSIYLGFIGGFSAQFTGSGFVTGTPFYYPTISRIYSYTGYNTTNYATYINGMSGSNAVGYYVDQNNYYHGILYNLVSGAYTPLNAPNGGGCPLTGIDGNNVVGYYADPNYGFNYSGFVYNLATAKYTATSIRDPLAPGNTFLEGISGNTLVGHYLDGNGVTHGFVATIPIPFTNLAVSRTNLVMSASNGTPGATCYVISTTDLTLPRSQWTVIATNTFNTNGVFSYTKSLAPGGSALYLGLREGP